MPRPQNARPSYLLHKPSGRARVRLNGVDVYLGRYNSPESWQKYHELLAKYPTPESRKIVVQEDDCVCIAELVAKFGEYACEHYRSNREERYRIKSAVTPLIRLYGSTPAAEFSPKKLKAVRQHLIDTGNARSGEPLSRAYVNALISVVKKIFKWGVSEELVPVEVHQALSTVTGLGKGRSANVREPAKVKPVPQEHISRVLDDVAPEVATMIQLQLLTGMRPDEVTIMRPCDINTTADAWIYTIGGRFVTNNGQGHKTDWLEDSDDKRVLLGPRAQELIEPWLLKRNSHEYLFSPKDVVKRCGRGNPLRPPRDHYDDETYGRAVRRACKRLGIPIWSPGRLRHNAATQVRQKYGAEAARLVLGHRHLSTTEIYAERDFRKYLDIVQECG